MKKKERVVIKLFVDESSKTTRDIIADGLLTGDVRSIELSRCVDESVYLSKRWASLNYLKKWFKSRKLGRKSVPIWGGEEVLVLYKKDVDELLGVKK